MTTLKQMIEAAKTLPLEDRRHLREWLQEQERQDAERQQPVETAAPRQAETVEQQVERFRKAMKWIDEHRAEYLGQWVVLVGDQLISHGFDGHQVADQAKAAGIEIPFLVRVREEPEAFCAGWH
ncbi:MAG: hypothetical protein L0Y75_03240 [Acidobacteria bacterium]|nr:hypothetical protein [Acidobacteriota bacterium]